MTAVCIEGVAVEHGGRAVLDIESLTIEERAFVLVVGPSGAGKTTLLRAIAGLARPARGRVTLFGAVASEGSRVIVRPEARRIGFVFQGGGLWPHMSVERTLDFVLACRGVPRRERARPIAELVSLVELSGFERRRPGELSGGEAQRLALARALALEPRLLLLDEPFGQLDVPLRESLAQRLADVHARLGLTTVVVTHDPREVDGIADATIAIAGGRVGGATEAQRRVVGPVSLERRGA